METTLYSIGHGHKTIEEFFNELNSFKISYLIDVRTVPYSKWSPQFNKEVLKDELRNRGHIKYAWWGNPDPNNDSYIGGRPLDDDCFDEKGHFDYKKMAEDIRFKNGLERLVRASKDGLCVALMCSESDPHKCHRSKLIGRELYFQYNINMHHIIGKSKYISEVDIIRKLYKDWDPNSLFPNQPEPYFISCKSYKKVSQFESQYYD